MDKRNWEEEECGNIEERECEKKGYVERKGKWEGHLEMNGIWRGRKGIWGERGYGKKGNTGMKRK